LLLQSFLTKILQTLQNFANNFAKTLHCIAKTMQNFANNFAKILQKLCKTLQNNFAKFCNFANYKAAINFKAILL